jgi:hypothetical protein
VYPGIPTFVSGVEGGPCNPPTLVSGGDGGPWNPYLGFRWGGWALESLPWFQVGRVGPGIPTLVSSGQGGPWNPYLGFRWGGWALEFTAVKCARLAGVAAGLQAGTLRPVQITPSSPIRNSEMKTWNPILIQN